jgi:hypothetical protein
MTIEQDFCDNLFKEDVIQGMNLVRTTKDVMRTSVCKEVVFSKDTNPYVFEKQQLLLFETIKIPD